MWFKKNTRNKIKIPTLFWTGKISMPLKILLNMGSLIAWISGNMRSTAAMKQRMKNGYDGKYSDYIHHYDELGSSHYLKISNKLIECVDCRDKEIIDVGCGTGILSLIVLEKGPAKLACVDLSKLMLEKCEAKINSKGHRDAVIEFHEADADHLPFEDNSFDIVLLNMVLGMIPDQQATISELARVLRSGGTLAISAHSSAHYLEAIEASLKIINLRYFLAHRFEFWPRGENEIRHLLGKANLKNVKTERLTWVDEFKNGADSFDFFASTTSLWWFDRLPEKLREKEAKKNREYFQSRGIKSITSDIVLAYGMKK